MRRLLLLASVLLLLPPLVQLNAVASAAQAPAADASRRTEPSAQTLRGKVLDPSGAPIAGARVTVAADTTESAPSTLTDQRGEFALALGPGAHTITVTAPGFVDATRELAAAQIGGEAIDVMLEVAGVQETVSVTAPAGYVAPAISTATKTLTPLRDVPQSVTVVTKELIRDQLMTSMGDVIRYVPGIAAHQGENNRDEVIIRGNRSSADFFVNGVRDDVQYYRDLYNLDRVEALKGPNAMIFGRGGGGGVVNRVVKEAGFHPLRDVTLQGGSHGNKRFTADLDQPINAAWALRLNGMVENSDSFRNEVSLERGAINPTITFAPNDRTKVTVGYEFLRDRRTADRGMTSFQGRPADLDVSTFYGNPDDSDVRADVHLGTAMIEHHFGQATLRNRTMVGNYDRGYQNFVPGAATADGSQVALTSYNNATDRTNVFNQTDLIYPVSTGPVRHTFLIGTEFGHQSTDNFRNTGFFNNTDTSVLLPFHNPTLTTPVTFRQSATDADNHVSVNTAAAYAQDQIDLSRHVLVIGGVRVDRFDLEYHNNRNGDTLDRIDSPVSPRVGVVYKPTTPVSIYGSYSIAFLPSSGDQFSSLTTITEQVEPEQFTNYEVGAKWDAGSALSLTTAVYRLDRTNTRSIDPNDPTRIVQTGSQRTNGFELGVNGQIIPRWRVAGGYAYQNAYVTAATAAARAGVQVGQVPHHTFSLWNNYQLHPRLSAGLGIVHRTDMFVAVDNLVTVPGYTRADIAAFFLLRHDLRLQANVENLFDTRYFVNADSNTNISPGTPRALRIALLATF